MLRLSSLIRSRAILKVIKSRAGPPGWDRPDPPPSAYVPYDHQLTDEEIIFFIPDRSQPEYVLTQPEIYVGDTFLQASPIFFKGWALFLAAAGIIGLATYIMSPLRNYIPPTLSELRWLKRYDDEVKFRQVPKFAAQNPMGIKINPEAFPRPKNDVSYSPLPLMEDIRQNNNKNQQIIKQVRSYLIGVKEKAEKKVNERLAAQAKHGSESHGHEQTHGQNHMVNHGQNQNDSHSNTENNENTHKSEEAHHEDQNKH